MPNPARGLAKTAGHNIRNLMRIDREVIDRARSPFPGEPIRTLDALHLASALVARAAVADLPLLPPDEKGCAPRRAPRACLLAARSRAARSDRPAKPPR